MPSLSHDDFLVLMAKRGAARERKDFAEADRIRKQVEEGGYWIEDGPDGYSFGTVQESVMAGLTVKTAAKPRKKKQ